MTAEVDRSREHDTCRKLISLGYARSNRVRLYGQEMKLVSDPFPEEGGIAVEVVVRTSPHPAELSYRYRSYRWLAVSELPDKKSPQRQSAGS